MAIQIRRGASTDFDATKMVAGELGVSTDDTHKLWATGQAGDSWELANKEDLDAEVEAREELAETVEAHGESLETKAEVDGTYDTLVVGNLLSNQRQTDSAPYLLRATADELGSSRIGQRCYETIIGASVGENQLVQNGDFADSSVWLGANATMTVSGNVATVTPVEGRNDCYKGQNLPMTIGHKYAVFGSAKAVENSASVPLLMVFFGSASNVKTLNSSDSNWHDVAFVFECASNQYNTVRLYSNTQGKTTQYKNVMAVDLTQMFGSSIADHIYSMEQATAGSGIAWIKSYGFFRDSYIPYNAGTLESVEAREKVCVGFNAWDEEWEVGGINPTTGEPTTGGNAIRSKNYIPVTPSTQYYYNSTAWAAICYYDSAKGFISREVDFSAKHAFTTPNNCCFVMFAVNSNYGTTYNHDICINLSNPDRNGEYEPYTSQTYALGNDKLRGLFKLDANNNLYADGDTKTADGVITRKYGVVDLGTLNWTDQANGLHQAPVPNKKKAVATNSADNILCALYSTVGSAYMLDSDKIIGASINNNTIFVNDTSYTSASAFKTAMSGVMLVYEAVTPTTETSTPFTSPQIVYPDGTEEFITENGVPVGHETEYPYDLKGLVEGLIDVPDVPSANGTYVLKATRSASGITYAWEVQS